MGSPLLRQTAALVRKNFIIKKRNLSQTLFEYSFPLILSCIIWRLNVEYLEYGGSGFYGELDRHWMFLYFILDTAFPILCSNVCLFILFQTTKESEIKVARTLRTMNLSSFANGLSYFII